MAKRRDEVKSNVKKLQKKKSQDSSILEIFRGRPDVMVGILLMICMLSFVVAPAIQTMMDGSSRSGSVDQDALQRTARNRTLLRRFLFALAEEAYGEESPETGQISNLQKIQFGMAPDIDPYGLARPMNQDQSDPRDMERFSVLAITHGMALSDDEAKAYVSQLADNVTAKRVQEIFDDTIGSDMSFENLLDLLKKEIEGIRLQSLVPPTIASTPTPSKAWQYQRDKNRRLSFQMYPISVADYLDQVDGTPTQEQRERIFYEAVNRVQSPNTRGHAYQKLPSFQFQYVKFNRSNYTLYANALQRLERENVTDEEIQEYYDTNINLYIDRSEELDSIEDEATNDGNEASEDANDGEGNSEADTEDDASTDDNADKDEESDADSDNADSDVKPDDSDAPASDPENKDGCQDEPTEETPADNSDDSADEDASDSTESEDSPGEDSEDNTDADGGDEENPEESESAEEEPEEPEVKYRPLAEVREQVIDGVLREKASAIATEMFNEDVRAVELKLKEFLRDYRKQHVESANGEPLPAADIQTNREAILAELKALTKTVTAKVEQILPVEPMEAPEESSDESPEDSSDDNSTNSADDSSEDSETGSENADDSSEEGKSEADRDANEASSDCQDEAVADSEPEEPADDPSDTTDSDDSEGEPESSEGETESEEPAEQPKKELVDRDYVLIEVGETELLTSLEAMEIRTKTFDVLLSEGLEKPDWYSLIQFRNSGGGHASNDIPPFINEGFKPNEIYRLRNLGGSDSSFASFSDKFLYINVDERAGRSISTQEEADEALAQPEVKAELDEFWKFDEALKMATDYADELANEFNKLAEENPEATLNDLGDEVAASTFSTDLTAMFTMGGGQFGAPQVQEADIRRVNPDVPAGQFGSSTVMRDLRFEAQVTGQFGQPQFQNRYTLTQGSPQQPVNLRLFRLEKGEAIMIPSHDLSTLYVVTIAEEEFGQFEASIQFHNALTTGSRSTGNPSQFNRQPGQVDYNYFLQRHTAEARAMQQISLQQFNVGDAPASQQEQ